MGPFISVKRNVKRAQILTKAEFKHALKVAGLTRDAERNQLLLCLTHCLGTRVTETALLTCRDLMYPSGRIVEEVRIRPETAKFGKGRNIPLSSAKLRSALEAYLEVRVAHGIGAVPGQTEFRGLAADLPLIRSGRGPGFSLSTKRRVMADGRREDYKACDPLSNAIDKLYARAGFPAASSHSGRRSFSSWLLADGVPVDVIQHLLGHQEVDYTAAYCEVSENAICRAFEVAL